MCANCLWIVVGCLSAQLDSRVDEKLEALPKQVLVAQELLLTKLQDDKLWFDFENQAVLLNYLRAANGLRPLKLAPILADNIAYMPRGFDLVPLDIQFPAYRALRSFGIDAVKPILAELKRFDPEESEIKTLEDELRKATEMIKLKHRAEWDRKQALLLRCLVDIYAQGGFGKLQARHRIELEVEKSAGVEKQRLLKALKHSALK